MNCPIKLCKVNLVTCFKSYWLFLVFLLLTIGIAIFKQNHALFYVINPGYTLLSNVIWKWINLVTYSKYLILPIILLIATLIWRKDMVFRVIVLIASFYIVFYVLKIAVGEARPYVVLDQNTFFWLDNHEDAFKTAYRSFPSGHTGNAAIFVFALNSLFFQNKPVIKSILFLILVLTALARICTGWHWPIDVLASGLIGYLLVKICLCTNKCNTD